MFCRLTNICPDVEYHSCIQTFSEIVELAKPAGNFEAPVEQVSHELKHCKLLDRAELGEQSVMMLEDKKAHFTTGL